MKYRVVILIINFLTITLFLSSNAYSQSIDWSGVIDSNTGLPIGVTEQISVEQIPKIPQPNENVSIRLTSYTTNLNKANITWTQDGKIILSQTGAVVNQIQAPSSGKTTKIIITIVKEKGGTLTKTITLSPADVDLIYEADTYAHPFFKGKKLFTSESFVNVIAVPNFIGSNGKQIPASNLVYSWKTNGTVQQAASGYGKNTFTVKGQLIERPVEVTVDVSAINSTLIATESITLKSTKPELVLYENNPLLGIMYDKAIFGNFLLERSQVDFEAIPYFFSGNTKNDSNILYKWAINGVKVTNKSQNENYLLLQNNNNEEGKAIISATIEHAQNLLQTTKVQLELNFKKVKNKNTTNETVNF